MARIRLFLAQQRWLALALAVAALAARIVVPAGMMPARGAAGPTLILCSGQMTMAGVAMPDKADTAMAMSGAHGSGAGKHRHGPAPEGPCAFTGLLAAAVDGAAVPALPPTPLPVAVLLSVVLLSATLTPRRLWPHRRGPPAVFA